MTPTNRSYRLLYAGAAAVALVVFVVAVILDAQELPWRATIVAALAVAIALASVYLGAFRLPAADRSTRDPLTGLVNRGTFDELLEREFARAARLDDAFVVAMLDLDPFDADDRDVADTVMRAVAGVLRASTRATDVAARLNEEQFVVVIVGVHRSQAVARLEQIRTAVGALGIEHRGERLPPVTVSIGVAEAPADGQGPASILRAADAALKVARRAGRNSIAEYRAG